MAWYRTGTVSVTNGSTTVTGSGTQWISGAGIGEAFYGPDGRVYEIANIVSATSITLGSAYLGASATGQAYQIIPSQSYIRDLAAQAAQLVSDYAGFASTAGAGKFGDGTLAAPGLRFTADENTGVRRAGSDDMRLVVGGVDQAQITTAGLSVQDGKLRITGSSDASKVAQFEVDGFTTATTRTFTLPNASTTLVGADTTQTLTNKTLTGGAFNGTLGATTPSTGAFTNVSYSGTFTGGTGVINIGSGQVYKDASGNVGVGTSSPAGKLHVNSANGFSWVGGGVTTADCIVGTQFVGGSLFVHTPSVNVNHASGLAIDGSYPAGANNVGKSVVNIKAVGVNFISSGYGSELAFHTSSNTTLTERLRIDSSGNVGIGTSAPVGRLSVITSADNSTQAVFAGASGGTGRGLRIATFLTSSNNEGAILDAQSTLGNPALSFQTGSTERMRIGSAGNTFQTQPAPAAVNATATLTVANLQTRIITSTTAAAVTGTLPTGTLMDDLYGGSTDMGYDWSVINTGANAFTVAAGTGHTVVGNMVVAAGTSASFRTRRTAANTWINYRIG